MAGAAVSGAFGFRFMRIGVMTVKEFHEPKTQAVNVKVDVSFFKIRRYGFPDGNFGMHPFNSLPGCGADAAAVEFRSHKEEIQVTPVSAVLITTPPAGLPSAMMRKAVPAEMASRMVSREITFPSSSK